MSRLLGFLLGSLLITAFTVASMFFFALHYILKVGGVSNCTWQASARAWLDSNGDGRIDPGESPLEEVEIHVDDIQNQLADVNWPAVTGKDGEVRLIASIPGCEATMFEIHVDIPEGFRITTRSRIEVQPEIWQSLDTGRIYYFGFEYDR
ncbi:MAG TPA: hypothetical protein VK897_20360 [Anaerolineales bacterium]|nr:hypothetical protein [Anaerolineales bacterium]